MTGRRATSVLAAGIVGVAFLSGCGGAREKGPMDAVKEAISADDVTKVIKVWGDVNQAGGLKFTPDEGRILNPADIARTAEDKPAVKEAITKGRMTVADFVEKAYVVALAADIVKKGGAETYLKTMDDMEQQMNEAAKAAGADKNATAGLDKFRGILKQMRDMVKAIPASTYDAVKPHADEIVALVKPAGE
jgi:hypothetical protein